MSSTVPFILSCPLALPLKLLNTAFTNSCTNAKSNLFKSAVRSRLGEGVLLSTFPKILSLSFPKISEEVTLTSTSKMLGRSVFSALISKSPKFLSCIEKPSTFKSTIGSILFLRIASFMVPLALPLIFKSELPSFKANTLERLTFLTSILALMFLASL
ncbi:hypothetical protein LEQ04_08960 [Riemerella anatipestifer]|nr:hypothetical protein LEQ03_02320 [Riemerella anatipestifer]WPC14690.1 hypothetical protein LEQ04_08960 [Riemerella anatipestifer]